MTLIEAARQMIELIKDIKSNERYGNYEYGAECPFCMGELLDGEPVTEWESAISQPAGHWTTQPPTEAGWYWFAPYEGPVDVVEVFKARNGNELLATDNMATYALKEMDGTWFSEPLTVPGSN